MSRAAAFEKKWYEITLDTIVQFGNWTYWFAFPAVNVLNMLDTYIRFSCTLFAKSAGISQIYTQYCPFWLVLGIADPWKNVEG